MKLNWIAILSVIFLLVPLSNSYGQSDNVPINLILQLEIRDESGQLVGFIESDRFTIVDYQTLSKFLDENGESLKKQNFIIDNQQVEVFTAVGSMTHQFQTVYSQSVISGASGIVALANHDGFLINPGDVTISTWTIIRNVP